MKTENNYKAVIDKDSKKLSAVFKSILVGAVSGLVVTAYRFTLMEAETLSFIFYSFLRKNLIYLPVALAALAEAGYFVGTLVKKNRMISGSGIPQVKGIIMGYFGGFT